MDSFGVQPDSFGVQPDSFGVQPDRCGAANFSDNSRKPRRSSLYDLCEKGSHPLIILIILIMIKRTHGLFDEKAAVRYV